VSVRLAEVHASLADMEAESRPARAAALLAGLGFSEEAKDKPKKSFSGGWRMRLALARVLFVRPSLLLLDEPSNHIDLNALAWLEDYLQTCARPGLFSHSTFGFEFGRRRLTSGQPTNHLDLEGLDALILALSTWNGMVELSSSPTTSALSRPSQESSGCVGMVQCYSSKATWKHTSA